MHAVRLLATLPVALALLGCEEQCTCASPDAGETAGVGGEWVGYVESYHFPSGSDQLRLTLDTSVPGVVTGSIAFGAGDPPPPATDPEVGYPPGVDWVMWGIDYRQPYEGARYELHEVQLDPGRLQLKIAPSELWSDWCALQTPILWSDDFYGCLPNYGGGMDNGVCYLAPPEGDRIIVDCGKQSLCWGDSVCRCTADSCVADGQLLVAFDLVVGDGTLDGSTTGMQYGTPRVHLTRQ
jgi:hypothetical protein